jgi:hypothetical protein
MFCYNMQVCFKINIREVQIHGQMYCMRQRYNRGTPLKPYQKPRIAAGEPFLAAQHQEGKDYYKRQHPNREDVYGMLAQHEDKGRVA